MEKFGKVCKEYMVKDIVEHFKSYPDFFISAFSKVSVGATEKLRKGLRGDSALYMVVKNSLVKRAMEESGKDMDTEEMKKLITGSCGLLFSKDDPSVAARSLVNFSRDNENFKIHGAFVNGEAISADVIRHLATLPSREVLLSMVAAGVQAPISGFARLLGNLLRNLVGVIDAISKKSSK